MSWKVRLTGYETQFIALADRINRAMPEHVVTVLTEALNERGRAVRGASILVLGVTYKPDVNDIRESTALEIIDMLARKGARVAYADPFVPQLDPGQPQAHRRRAVPRSPARRPTASSSSPTTRASTTPPSLPTRRSSWTRGTP